MITYSSEGVKFPSIKKRETSNWIHRVVESYGKKVGEIGYMFVNDEKESWRDRLYVRQRREDPRGKQ